MFHSFILSLCSNTLTLESVFEYIRQKLIKNMLILKFHPGMKCLHVFFFFFSSRDEISSWQKRVNSKRHFTIDRDDFIPGWKKEKKTCKHFIPGRNFQMSMFLINFWRMYSNMLSRVNLFEHNDSMNEWNIRSLYEKVKYQKKKNEGNK